MKRADIVLVTGGLGPTKDDITKQTLCKYFGTRLIFSEAVFENVKRVLAGKIPMNALNKSQAMVPEDCIVINNRVGSASVSWFEKDGKVVAIVEAMKLMNEIESEFDGVVTKILVENEQTVEYGQPLFEVE
jgi:nicotinamide-nucleotide amidase